METKNSQPRYIDERYGTRIMRTWSVRSARGEEIVAEFTLLENDHTRWSLPVRWKNHGKLDRELETWWSVQVYVYDEDDGCRGLYNPTERCGARNFEWILEGTAENLEKLSCEIERRAGIEA